MSDKIDQLLSQIQSETARDLIELVQPSRDKKTVATGIALIDDILTEVSAPKHGGGPVIELLGQPGSGKTQMLYHICAKAALPSEIALATSSTTAEDVHSKKIALNGCNKHVLIVDIDGRVDLRVLSLHMEKFCNDVMEKHGLGCLPDRSSTRSAIGSALKQALERVHVFSPSTTNSLVATLGIMPKYLSDRSIAGPVVLLMDGLGNNYWIDRKEASYIRLVSKKATPWFRLQQVLIDTLQQFCQQFCCLTVATSLLMLPASDPAARFGSQETKGAGNGEGSRQTKNPNDRKQQQQQQQQRVIEIDTGEEYRDHMIPRWQNIVSQSFVLERTSNSASISESSAGVSTTVMSITPIDSEQHRQKQKQCVMHVGDNGLLY
ncbi:hypothetical protein GGI25_002136 [Coemansia spiralis]|uniref:DNA recombination and repair protein Rad51-like C-terminal domain-containing protein n=2 Tax=Coemansia TaxID=4863 RepID=A0A9W8GAU8_9FUNG|nr:hypothetical protein EDC05_001059 [Coemansia umbellata]KAJ2625621.1 hypothetical protein GGI26_000421 [Coemansia sp. RSA 1358]KAJ2678751.1 hypothetical protein GGI25_002136 [Coemansia spiralis]